MSAGNLSKIQNSPKGKLTITKTGSVPSFNSAMHHHTSRPQTVISIAKPMYSPTQASLSTRLLNTKRKEKDRKTLTNLSTSKIS